MPKNLPKLQRTLRPEEHHGDAQQEIDQNSADRSDVENSPGPRDTGAPNMMQNTDPVTGTDQSTFGPVRTSSLKQELDTEAGQDRPVKPEQKGGILKDKNTHTGRGLLENRQKRAAEIISKYANWSSAGGLIPVPYLDVLTVSGIQARMVMELALLHEVPFRPKLLKTATAAIAGGAAPHALSGVTASVVAKHVPGIGTIAGTIGMAGFSYVSTRILGQIFTRHFAAGEDLNEKHLASLRKDFQREIAKNVRRKVS